MRPIKELLKEAKNEYELRFVLNYGNMTNPTGAIRRSWIKIFNQRLREFGK